MSLYQELWSQLPIPALLVTGDDTVQELNLAAEQFLGVSAKVILGQPVWNYLRGEELLPAGLERARATSRPMVISQMAGSNRGRRLLAGAVKLGLRILVSCADGLICWRRNLLFCFE